MVKQWRLTSSTYLVLIDATTDFGKIGFDGTELKNSVQYQELPITVVPSSMYIWFPKLVY